MPLTKLLQEVEGLNLHEVIRESDKERERGRRWGVRTYKLFL